MEVLTDELTYETDRSLVEQGSDLNRLRYRFVRFIRTSAQTTPHLSKVRSSDAAAHELVERDEVCLRVRQRVAVGVRGDADPSEAHRALLVADGADEVATEGAVGVRVGVRDEQRVPAARVQDVSWTCPGLALQDEPRVYSDGSDALGRASVELVCTGWWR